MKLLKMLNGNVLDVSLNELNESSNGLQIVARNFVGKMLSDLLSGSSSSRIFLDFLLVF